MPDVADSPPSNGGTYVRWQDMRSHESEERNARHTLSDKFDAKYEVMAGRIDRIESTLDKLAGAKGLLVATLGSSILSAIGVLVAILVALR